MAIQSEAIFFGAPAPQAYSRIESIVFEGNRVMVTVRTWFSASAAAKILESGGLWDGHKTQEPALDGFSLELTGSDREMLEHFAVPEGPVEGDNLRAQAYRLLMDSAQFVNPVAV